MNSTDEEFSYGYPQDAHILMSVARIADDNTLIPPFITIDGLGETVAKKIVEERVENFKERKRNSKRRIIENCIWVIFTNSNYWIYARKRTWWAFDKYWFG